MFPPVNSPRQGDTVAAGDLIAVIEEMKMEPLFARQSGVVTGLRAELGVIVSAGPTASRTVAEPADA